MGQWGIKRHGAIPLGNGWFRPNSDIQRLEVHSAAISMKQTYVPLSVEYLARFPPDAGISFRKTSNA